MSSRNWFLFLVVSGCAWAIGFFMGSPEVGTAQNVVTASGANASGHLGFHEASKASSTPDAEGNSKSIYSIAEQMRGISGSPSARWRRLQFARLAESVAVADIPRVYEELQNPNGGEGWEIRRFAVLSGKFRRVLGMAD